MSQQKQYTIRCPQCNGELAASLYDSVNIAHTPKLKEDLIRNKLNKVTCGACHFQFTIDKRLLYHDPENHLMILLLPSTLEQLKETEAEFRESVDVLTEMLPEDVRPPQLYLVLNRIELIEKIFLQEKNIDVREAEYIKYLIYTKHLDRIDPQKKNLLFNLKDSTDESLCFVVQDIETGALENCVEFNQEAFRAIRETFDQEEQARMIEEFFPGPYISARSQLLTEACLE